MSAAGSLIAAVARILLGPPNAQLSSAIEWRYGTQGSLAINLVKNVWHDHEAGRGGGVLELIKRETALDGRDCFGWLEQHGLRAMAEACAIATPGRDGGIAAIYNYTDERDTLLFQVVRYNPKRFVQRRPNVSGWTWSTVGVRQVPYRLPEVLEAIALERTVVVVEGERDADTLWGVGIPATTNSGGAGKWKRELTPHFGGADVIVIPDNDAAGKNHALSVAAALAPIVKRVRRLDLAKHWPEMPDKADVSDWLAAGHTREELDALIAQAPDWSPHADEGAHPAQEAQQEAKPEPPPALHWHGEVDISDSRPWLVQDLIPEVGCGLISGQWGSFKTFTALDLAHCIMTGEPFLGCEVVRRGGVLFIAVEGASEVPIRLQGVIEHKGKLVGRAPLAWTETCPPLIAADTVATLSKLAEQAAAARLKADFGLPLSLIVIDTVVAAAGYFKEGADNDTATGQVVMRTLAQLARNAGCFVFGIDHFGKDVNVGTRGTSAKEGAADVVLAMLGERTVSGEVVNTRLALRKRRGGSSGQEFPFKPRVVDMGVDRRGAPVTTLVLDWGAKDEHPKTAKDDWGHAKSLKLLRRIIMGLLADSGTDLRPWADGPTVRALNVDLVRAEFCKTWSVKGDTEKAKRDARSLAFRRALNDAVVKGFVVVREDLVWLASAAPAQHA